jgi:hypothetical protein
LCNRDSLPRGRCEQIINGFAPHLYQWPETLLGQLLGETVITEDRARNSLGAEVNVTRFTYQRFADYTIVSTLLKPLNGDPARLREALAPGKPLRKRLLEAPAGWIEALAVHLPERFDVELMDAARWRLKPFVRHQWDRAFVRSLAARRPSAATNRSRELFSRVKRRAPNLSQQVLEIILTVAPQPQHLMNAEALHHSLRGMSMPTRDVAWSIPTYFAFDRGGALDRLIRWAARSPHADCPDEVVELTALPLIWTFTSPNRRMRDYATKALARLLSGRLSLLPSIIERFDGVDDPYVIERLAVVSHGAVLYAGSAELEVAVAVAHTLKRIALAAAQVPNIITRDAVRGTYEWCLQHHLIDDHAYEEVAPPYRSAPPAKPRTKKQLERAYQRNRYDSKGQYVRSLYSTLFSSIFDSGDFVRYVVKPKLSYFSQHPLSQPLPGIRKPRTQRLDEAKWAEFEANLSADQIALANDDLPGFEASLSSATPAGQCL